MNIGKTAGPFSYEANIEETNIFVLKNLYISGGLIKPKE